MNSELLNDLCRLIRLCEAERLACEGAIVRTEDPDLQALLRDAAVGCSVRVMELSRWVRKEGGHPPDEIAGANSVLAGAARTADGLPVEEPPQSGQVGISEEKQKETDK